MARRRLIIHGSQEELEMFEPIYDTRLRLQHGTASTSRFHVPEPPPDPPSAECSERPAAGVGDDHHEGAVANYIQTADDEKGSSGGGAAVEKEETTCWRSGSDDESENYESSLPDVRPHSITLTEDDQVGIAEQCRSTGLQDTDTDSDSDS